MKLSDTNKCRCFGLVSYPLLLPTVWDTGLQGALELESGLFTSASPGLEPGLGRVR